MPKYFWELGLKETVEPGLSKLDKLADKTSGKFDGLQNKLNGIHPALGAIASPAGLAVGAIGAVAAGLYKSTEMALDFEKSMAKINATAQLDKQGLNGLRDELIEIGKSSTTDIERIPDAFEKINSQVNDVPKSLEILKTATKGAQAGSVDVDLAAGALAQTMSIIGEKAKANEVMDTLLKAKAVGAGEFSDFAQYLPQLTAAGSNLGIEFKDVAGMFAYMTAKGQSAADSAMLMQNAFTAMGKSDIQKGLAKAGVNIFDKKGAVRAMEEIMADLNARMSGMSDQTKSNFLESVGLKDAQAKNAFAVLASDATKLRNIMGDVRKSNGELNNQLKATFNWSDVISKGWNQIKAFGLSIGNIVLDLINGTVEWYNKSQLVQDIVWAIGEIFSALKFAFSELYDFYGKTLGKIFDRLEDGYRLIKAGVKGEFMKEYNAQESKNYHDLAVSTLKEKGIEALAAKHGKSVEFMKAFIERGEKAQAKGAGIGGDKKGIFGDPKSMLGSSINSGLKNVSEGGKTVRNITVNITNGVKEIIINPATLKESAMDIKQTIEEIILRGVQGAEVAMANS